MTIRSLVLINACLLVAFGAQVVFKLADASPQLQMAEWAVTPQSVEEASDLASEVVTAKVVKIRKAKPISVKIEGEKGGFDRIPAEVVTFEMVGDATKGRSRKGARIDVYRTGHSDAVSPKTRKAPPMSQAPPKPEGGIEKADAPTDDGDDHQDAVMLGLTGDPPYVVGEEYVLFLTDGPELEEEQGGGKVETRRVISPEGRFRVTAAGLAPMSDRVDFAKGLRGRPVRELTGKVR